MKKPFLLLVIMVLLGLARPGHGQGWQWARTLTGLGYSAVQPRALAIDAQGNAFVAGTLGGTQVFGSTSLTNNTGTGFVGKIAPTGQWLWAVAVPGFSTVGPTATNAGFGAAVADAAGNVYFTGTMEGTVTFGSTVFTMPAGVTDVFVAKLSAQGQWQWASRSVGAAGGSSQGLGLALDPATGDLALAARFKGTFGFGTTTLTDASGGSFTDGVVARLGSAGQWRWARAVATTRDDALAGVAFDGAGDLYVTGYVTSSLTLGSLPPLPSARNLDALVARLSADGQTWRWAMRFGGNGDSHGVAALPLATGEVAIAGDFENSVSLGGTLLTSRGNRDIYVARLDAATGAEVAGSARQAGSQAGEDLTSVVSDASGNLLLGGNFTGQAQFGSTYCLSPTVNFPSAFAARFLANGTWAWAVPVLGVASVTGQGLATDATGTYVYLAGVAASGARFGSTLTIPTFGSPMFYVARMSAVLATRPAALGGQAVQLWPNPATGQCAVRVPALPGATAVAATLLDGLGRPVRHFTLPSGTTTALDLAGVPAGLYVLRLAAGAETTTLRLAVE